MFKHEIKILKALANGTNYFTGEICENDSILNDPNIIRTLYNICDELENIKIKKNEFIYPLDIEEKFPYENELCITKITEKISKLYPDMKKINYKLITEQLIQNGILERIIDKNGKNITIAKDNAKEYGIYNVSKINAYGVQYNSVTYDINGQKYVLSLLKNIKNI